MISFKRINWKAVDRYSDVILWVAFFAILVGIIISYDYRFDLILNDIVNQIKAVPDAISNFFIDLHQSAIVFKDFLRKLWDDFWLELTFMTGIGMITFGILKRIVVENIFFPTLKEFFFVHITEGLTLYIAMKKIALTSFSIKFQIAVVALFGGPLAIIISIFKWLSVVWFILKKYVFNSFFSLLKKILLKYIPVLLTGLFSTFPIIQDLFNYYVLEKFLNWAETWYIIGPVITSSLKGIRSAVDKLGHLLDTYVNAWLGGKIENSAKNLNKWLLKKVQKSIDNNQIGDDNIHDIDMFKAELEYKKSKKAMDKAIAKDINSQKMSYKIKKGLIWTTIISLIVYTIWAHWHLF